MNQFQAPDSIQQRWIWVVIGFCVVAPLSCLSKMDALKFTSFLAIVFVAFLTVLIIAYAVPGNGLDPCLNYNIDDHEGQECVGEKSVGKLTLDVFRVFTIFIFAFACQTNIFGVSNELQNPSRRRLDLVIAGAIGTAALVYGSVAFSGYSTYGENVESNILRSYPNTVFTSCVRISVSLLVAFSYPLQCQPSRNSALALWRSLDGKGAPEPDDRTRRIRFWVVTAMYLCGTFGIAMVLDDLGVVLALVGGTGSTMIAFVLPGIAYYRLCKDDGPSVTKYCALALFCAGCIIMPLAVTFIFV